MCSLSSQQVMENYQGDLTDIVRGTGTGTGTGPPVSSDELIPNWQFTSDTMTVDEQEQQQRSDGFGDPFSSMADPLLQDLDMPPDNSSTFFPSTSKTSMEVGNPSFEGGGGFVGSNTTSGSIFGPALSINNLDMEEIKRANNNTIFTKMLQISPTSKLQMSPASCDSPVMGASPRGVKSPVVISPNDMILSPSTVKGGLVDNNNTTMQISSPRNPGIKRRKSQAKKVVCIPAPAAASGRPTGEVVPSDLWAWRKYGQKPIKGSPYPRGYYRCSSSKGCSARKQVERSRTDPNMLVITYTSEHNHPWPTQRNALAGSTRSQLSKNNNNNNSNGSSNSNAVSKNLNQSQKHAASNNVKDEQSKEITTPDDSNSNNSNNNNNNNSSPVIGQEPLAVKTETAEGSVSEYNHPEMDVDGGNFEYFAQSYKPTMIESDHQGDDFFAELGEIGADPLNILLYNQGFSTTQRSDQHKEGDNKTFLDPFTELLDWSSEDHNPTTSTLFGDPNGGL